MGKRKHPIQSLRNQHAKRDPALVVRRGNAVGKLACVVIRKGTARPTSGGNGAVWTTRHGRTKHAKDQECSNFGTHRSLPTIGSLHEAKPAPVTQMPRYGPTRIDVQLSIQLFERKLLGVTLGTTLALNPPHLLFHARAVQSSNQNPAAVVVAVALPSMARASKHRALRQWSGSPAWLSRGRALQRRSVRSSRTHKAGACP